jgi:hypothetical protein
MSDVSITATNVVAGGNAEVVDGTAGATISAGQVVYLDPETGTLKLADCDSATAAARSPLGVALNGAAAGQPVRVQKRGNITIGGTVTAGVAYYLSATAGGICPVGDLGGGDYPVFLGFATSASVLRLNIVESGVALAE